MIKSKEAWILNANNAELGSVSRPLSELRETMVSLHTQIERDGLDVVDVVLTQLNVETANVQHTIAVLRSLFSMKNAMRNWYPTQAAVRKAFKRRFSELDIKRVMRGLDVEPPLTTIKKSHTGI